MNKPLHLFNIALIFLSQNTCDLTHNPHLIWWREFSWKYLYVCVFFLYFCSLPLLSSPCKLNSTFPSLILKKATSKWTLRAFGNWEEGRTQLMRFNMLCEYITNVTLSTYAEQETGSSHGVISCTCGIKTVNTTSKASSLAWIQMSHPLLVGMFSLARLR